MKKKVNGKVIEIPNMDLIEKGFEGLALGRLVSSYITDTVSDDSELMNKCIKQYDSVYKSLPFPLYAIEENIKYSMMAMYLRDTIDEPIEMWVDSALFVAVDKNRALKFVGNTWAVVSIEKIQDDNTDIDNYNGEPGYTEYAWVLQQLMEGKSLSGYYNRFMKSFVEACNNEPMVLKWELTRLLDFGYVPKEMQLNPDKLYDVDSKSEYFIDIFSAGKRQVPGFNYQFDLTSKGEGLKKTAKYTEVFDFEVYEKKVQPEDVTVKSDIRRIQKCNLDGLAAIFETVVGKGSLQSTIDDITYTGIIVGDDVFYQIGGSLYRCRAKKYEKGKEIARNIELYGYENGLIYMLKKSLCSSGVTKEAIYAYGVKDSKIRLCKISYT